MRLSVASVQQRLQRFVGGQARQRSRRSRGELPQSLYYTNTTLKQKYCNYRGPLSQVSSKYQETDGKTSQKHLSFECVCVLGRIICMFIAVSVCLWDRGKFPYLSLRACVRACVRARACVCVCVCVHASVYVNITAETVPFSGWVETQVSGLVLKLNVADWSGSEY